MYILQTPLHWEIFFSSPRLKPIVLWSVTSLLTGTLVRSLPCLYMFSVRGKMTWMPTEWLIICKQLAVLVASRQQLCMFWNDSLTLNGAVFSPSHGKMFISQSMLSWGKREDVYTQIKEIVLGNTFHYAWRGPCLNSKSSIKVITMYCFCSYKSTMVTALEPCHPLSLCGCM